ncbi:MAG: porin family protein [Prevotella sp.]
MKKILFAAVLMLSSASAFAQHAVGSFTLQPKVGLNIANMTDMDDSDPRVGFVGGVEGEYQVTDIFSLSAGVLYSMQGCKLDNSATFAGYTLNGDVTYKTDYINIPIMANVYVVKGLAVKLGIQPGFNVNAKAKVSASGAGLSADQSYDLADDVKTFDFTIPVGLSYEYANVVLDARYNWGLTKIVDAGDDSPKNSVFQITLGYKFDL